MDLKRVLPTGVAVVSTIAAGVCAFGWYTSATWGEEEDFSSCKDLGGLLELTYTYGSGDVLRFTQDPRGKDMTLSYQVKQAGGDQPAIAYIDRLLVTDRGGKVYDPDGKIIECEQVDPEDQD
ncbi:hypothetical protein [Nocardioides jishulii]|uniref:Uncharacterized protein n=1 Tax=Nocardioides jishulii TaxID=2575440 RepID=A0A4U2YQR9_9ACTN|nr:hypothetical protein [Nocardioides jishulii]QCX26419.1 hypothetical protein FCL41_01830 [Nocardioides jishulii]TKI63776.1 hypothetical protein FC770_00875 [Nocardioides jishulii]